MPWIGTIELNTSLTRRSLMKSTAAALFTSGSSRGKLRSNGLKVNLINTWRAFNHLCTKCHTIKHSKAWNLSTNRKNWSMTGNLCGAMRPLQTPAQRRAVNKAGIKKGKWPRPGLAGILAMAAGCPASSLLPHTHPDLPALNLSVGKHVGFPGKTLPPGWESFPAFQVKLCTKGKSWVQK